MKTHIYYINISLELFYKLVSSATSPQFQYQPISVDHCKSMELVRVRWCSDLCSRSTDISTAVSSIVSPCHHRHV